MLTEVHLAQQIEGVTLDEYLAKGWYRMQHAIFTTHALKRDGMPLTAIWLRNCLDRWRTPSSYIKLQKRNKKFSLSIEPFTTVTQEQADLFSAYRRVTFGDRNASLHDYLLDANGNQPYNSYSICCYDENILIGCGIFDLGFESAAGIVSFYDRNYDAHSLGRYIIYAMIEYCKAQGFHYFYPGYVVPGDKAFDYKLGIGSETIEFFRIRTRAWLPWSEKDAQDDLVLQLRNQLEQASKVFQEAGHQSTLVFYENFDLATSIMMHGRTLDQPYFIRTDFPASEGMELIVTGQLYSEEMMIFEIPSENFIYSEAHQMDIYTGVLGFHENARP